uniref:Globin n=1 Tax=Polypedilum nubifer TaxID=54969 RepID=V5YMI8_9DIPT|nr:globin [Polypedilum nubifer]
MVAAATASAVLNADEARLVQTAWAAVKNSEVDILYAVFKANPDIQARFPKFVGKDLDSVKGSADFALHAARIVSFFTDFINLVGNDANTPALDTLLRQLASDHKNRGVTTEQISRFTDTLTGFVSSHAPWGDNVAAAWAKGSEANLALVRSVIDG